MSKHNNTLLMDCGNTFLKWCISDEEGLSDQQQSLHKDASVLEIFKQLIDEQSDKCNAIIIVSVLGEVFSAGAKKISEDAGLDFTEIESEAALAGLRNGYKNPAELGTDRLVAMVAGYELINDLQACIVIDSGTATTIDAVDETGEHLGGVIFPGLQLSLESLSSNTKMLPMIHADEKSFETDGLATDTSHAIASGCVLSLAGAIDGICNKMQQQLEARSFQPSVEVKRILCGGGAKVLIPYLENNYDYHEDLIMHGLRKIAAHND